MIIDMLTKKDYCDKEKDRIIKANIQMAGFISLVKRMREAQKKVVAYNAFGITEKYKKLWADTLEDRIKLEQEVDEYLKKTEEII